MTEYWLQIVFKSNERPWRNDRYDAYKIDTDAAAIKWAAYMQDHMPEYQITLFKDGKALPYDQAQQEAAQGASELQQNVASREAQRARPADQHQD